MDAKRKKRMIIWVSVAALLGVGGYIAWTVYKSKKAKPDAQTPSVPETTQPSGGTATSQSQTSNQTASSTTGYQSAWKQAKENKALTFSFQGKVYSTVTGTVVNNPFTSSNQIKTFQTFVKNVLKDDSIGSIDGVWGPRTAAAFIKYANQYYANK